MIIKAITASCLKDYQTITIGRQMEDNHRQFVFDCSGFDEEVTSIELVHQRSEDVAPYPVTTASTETLTWTVTDTDTAYAGGGRAELRIRFANGMAKTAVFNTSVIASITGDTVIPEPLESWYDALIDYIDDHAASPEQIEAAVEAYLEDHPIPAPVQSVNGKQGAVVLTATDVGALSDQTTIPTKTSDLTNDSGFITSVPVTSVNSKTGAVELSAADVGAYTKPSGGIPKTDLTAAVQASLDKADTALQAAPVTSVDGKTGAVQIMPSGGTTGQVLTKTASGTAWQTVSGGSVDSVNGQTGTVVLDASDVGALPDDTTFVSTFNGQSGAVTYTAPVTSVNGQTGAVTLSIPTVPTNVSAFTNDAGYLTQHQSLTAYQTKAITDTGGYFTTDTVEGALQEIGAEIAGINTLIGTGEIS